MCAACVWWVPLASVIRELRMLHRTQSLAKHDWHTAQQGESARGLTSYGDDAAQAAIGEVTLDSKATEVAVETAVDGGGHWQPMPEDMLPTDELLWRRACARYRST